MLKNISLVINQSGYSKLEFVTKGMISYWINITASVCGFSFD